MTKVLHISNNAVKLAEHFECSGNVSKYLKAYPDTGKIPTIGIGTTRYPDGRKVKLGDTCTLEQAYYYFRHDVTDSELRADALTVDTINQNQFDVIVDFIYNAGWSAYRNSKLRQAINNNPSDYKEIVKQLLRWKYDDGVEQPGLVRRCKARAFLYCHGELKFYFADNERII